MMFLKPSLAEDLTAPVQMLFQGVDLLKRKWCRFIQRECKGELLFRSASATRGLAESATMDGEVFSEKTNQLVVELIN